MNNQKGFTLIELVVVIVIIGILAAVAVPRFVDLSGQAEQAKVEGIAGAISSGMAINYAACAASDFTAVVGGCDITVQNCDSTDALKVLNTAPDLTVYTYAQTTAPTGQGDAGECSITLTADNTIATSYTIIQTAP